MSHVPRMNEPYNIDYDLCRTRWPSPRTHIDEYEHMSMSHVTRMNESCHTDFFCRQTHWPLLPTNRYRRVMSTWYGRVMSYRLLSMSHVTQYERVMSHRLLLVTNTYEWVMSHRLLFVTNTYEWVMSHRLLFVSNTYERVMSHRLLFVSNTCERVMSHRLLFVLNTHERVMSHRLLFVSNTLALATYERRDNSVISPLLLVCVTERGREQVSQRASVYKRGRMSCIVLQCVAVCCSVLQFAAVCCSASESECVRTRIGGRASERAYALQRKGGGEGGKEKARERPLVHDRERGGEKGEKRKRERERKATVRMVNSCQ